MKNVKQPKRKYPVLKRGFNIDVTTNVSSETKATTEVCLQISGALKKRTFVQGTTDTKGVIKSHTNNHLRNHFNTTLDTVVYSVSNPGVQPSSLYLYLVTRRQYLTRPVKGSGTYHTST